LTSSQKNVPIPSEPVRAEEARIRIAAVVDSPTRRLEAYTGMTGTIGACFETARWPTYQIAVSVTHLLSTNGFGGNWDIFWARCQLLWNTPACDWIFL